MKESTFKKHCLVIDEWFVNGFNGTKAWQEFYVGSTEENAANRFLEIVRNSEIVKYTEEKMQNKSEELGISLSKQLERLNYIIDATEGVSYNDKINAIKEQNKLLALYKQHNEQKKPQTTNVINLGAGSNPDETTT